jgi:hypothetical protein
MDGDLYLPKSWDEDRQRCREADIPDEVVYRPKRHIALELYDRAVTNGVRFQWLSFDERFGAELDFLRALAGRGQKFVAEVPRTFRVGIDRPRAAGSSEPQTVEQLAQSHPRWAGQAGTRWRMRGPLNRGVAWLVKHVPIHLQDERGLADGTYHLLVCAHGRREIHVEQGNTGHATESHAARGPGPGAVATPLRRWKARRGTGALGGPAMGGLKTPSHSDRRQLPLPVRRRVSTAAGRPFLSVTAFSMLEVSGPERNDGPEDGSGGMTTIHDRDRRERPLQP